MRAHRYLSRDTAGHLSLGLIDDPHELRHERRARHLRPDPRVLDHASSEVGDPFEPLSKDLFLGGATRSSSKVLVADDVRRRLRDTSEDDRAVAVTGEDAGADRLGMPRRS